MFKERKIWFEIFLLTVVVLVAMTLMGVILSKTMRLMFVTDITFVNQSGKEVIISCLGVFQSRGRQGERIIGSLPLCRKRQFMTFKWVEYLGKAAGIALAPGERKTLHYDWDDINFCWILIRDKSDNYKVIRTELSDDPSHCCNPPLKKVFVIPPLSKLPDAPKELIEIAEAEMSEEHK